MSTNQFGQELSLAVEELVSHILETSTGIRALDDEPVTREEAEQVAARWIYERTLNSPATDEIPVVQKVCALRAFSGGPLRH